MAATVKHNLPLFPDIVEALTATWSNPHSAKLMLHGCAPFMDLWGMEGAGLVHMPPEDRKLASYLAPLANKGMLMRILRSLTSTVTFRLLSWIRCIMQRGWLPNLSRLSLCCRLLEEHTQAQLWPQESSAQSSWMRSLLQPTSFCACPGTPFWRGRSWELLWWESVILPQGCLVQLWRQCRSGSRPKISSGSHTFLPGCHIGRIQSLREPPPYSVNRKLK